MAEDPIRSTVNWASGINLLIGIWLFLSPWALAYWDLPVALWNNLILGAVIFVLAAWRVSAPRATAGVSWINFVLGIWLVISPFILDYGIEYGTAVGATNAQAATWNDVIFGIAVLAFAALSARAARQPTP